MHLPSDDQLKRLAKIMHQTKQIFSPGKYYWKNILFNWMDSFTQFADVDFPEDLDVSWEEELPSLWSTIVIPQVKDEEEHQLYRVPVSK